MEKKTILIEISDELIEKIDRLDPFSDRSSFISSLLEEKLNEIETKKLLFDKSFFTKKSHLERQDLTHKNVTCYTDESFPLYPFVDRCC